eukprot:426422_1
MNKGKHENIHDKKEQFNKTQHSLTSTLEELWQINEIDRKKSTTLLSKIFENILSHLSELEKYGDLNFVKIRTKFEKCKPALNLLFIAGFKESNDGQRLRWQYDEDRIKSLRNVSNTLQAKLNNKNVYDLIDQKEQLIPPQESTKMQAIEQLVNEGFTREDAIMAVALSSNETVNTQSTIINHLKALGFDINTINQAMDNVNDNQNMDAIIAYITINKDPTTNIKQQQNYRQMTNDFLTTNFENQSIDCTYLLNSGMNYSAVKNIDDRRRIICHSFISECPVLKTICRIMKKYNVFMTYQLQEQKNTKDKNENKQQCQIHEVLNNAYDNIALLNDFNHLLFAHQHQFEDIYNTFINNIYHGVQCNLRECLLLRRNNRNRSETAKKK